MSRVAKRKIVIDGKKYLWTLKGNYLKGHGEEHLIRVHSEKLTKSILYIDPFSWNFEVRPKLIRKAILFALSIGWNPRIKEKGFIVSMNEDKFYKLPKGFNFGYEVKKGDNF